MDGIPNLTIISFFKTEWMVHYSDDGQKQTVSDGIRMELSFR